MAQLLIKLHPWADQVKFTRGGGEANAVAVRIARASTKKQNIAFVDIMDGMIGTYLQI